MFTFSVSTSVCSVSACFFVTTYTDGGARHDWPITGSRVVNDVHGRRPRGGLGGRPCNTDEVSHTTICHGCLVILLFAPSAIVRLW